MGQIVGGGLRGKASSQTQFQGRVGPAFWRRDTGSLGAFLKKSAEAGVCEECGQKAAGGLLWEGVGEGRWLLIPSSPSSQDSSQL